MNNSSPHRLEILASNVLYFGLLVAVADIVRAMPAMFQRFSTLATVLLGVLVLAGFYYAIRRGVTWVKWLFVLGQAASLVYSLVQYRTTLLPLLHTAWWPAFAYVAFFGSRIVAMFLLLPTLRSRRLSVD